MFNIYLDYPSYAEEIEIVRTTTDVLNKQVEKIISGEDILAYQKLVRQVPVTDNVLEFAVRLVQHTRPGGENKLATEWLEWGAGPRASQYLILGAKCHALLNGKYSPDIEDVQAVAIPVLRHRIVRNFKAEASGLSVNELIQKLISGGN
jgi:MoxR-like ATPase